MRTNSKKTRKRKCFNPPSFSFGLILLCFMLCSSNHAFSSAHGDAAQQENQIIGIVRDLNGEAIIGATVTEKGTNTGTITDAEGRFKLKVGPNAVLLISYTGYQTQEIAYKGQPQLEITLEESVKEIDELVVIGYGTAKKKDLTGAIGTASGDLLTQTKNMSLSNALQGAVPGLMVTRTAGMTAAEVKVRGITTIGDSSPLIIVDGSPVDDMNVVNPNDIESVSVLKDAASASIYGARAAAGVILITTKRAKENTFHLKYSTEFGYERMTARPQYADVVRFMEVENELRWNDAGGEENNRYLAYAKDLVENYLELHAQDPDIYPNTDWWGLVMKNGAPRQSHYLDMMGGTKNIKTKITLGYDKVEGLYENKENNRFTFRVNNDLTINKFLSTTFDLGLRRANSLSPNINPLTSSGNIHGTSPLNPALWQDGRYASIGGVNMYAQVRDGGTTNVLNNQFSGKISLSLKPMEGLVFTGLFASNLKFYKSKAFTKKLGYYAAKDPAQFVAYFPGNEETKLDEARNDSYNYTIQFLGNYEKSINKTHNFNATIGYEAYSAFNENLSAGRGHFDLSNYPYLNLGSMDYRTNGGSATENAYQSYFGRIMYNYKSRYLLQVNVRRDASSRFAKEHRWGTFPSVSAGWVISEEAFYNIKSWMPYMKLRLSWGTLGNERIGNYPYQSSIRYTKIIMNENGEVISSQASVQSNFAIKDISWETTESIDAGFDAYFLGNRLRLTADFYKKETKDMLLALEIPDYVGYDNPEKNTGSMYTTGFEVETGWSDVINDWKYGISINLSDFVSKMGNLGGTEFLGSKVKKEGSEFNEWYGYVSDGLFLTQDDLDNSPKVNDNMQVGDVKYKDISGPDGVPDGKISPEYDRVLLGGSLPRFMYGGNLFVGYKSIDFSVMFQGVGKQNSLLSTEMVQPLRNNRNNVPVIIDGKYWSAYKTDEENRQAVYPRLSYTNSEINYAMSDYWLFDGSYFRIKNITLGYTLPTNITKHVGISQFRIYISMNDLPAFSNYPEGWDPEMTGFAYPITSSYILGASINF
jgi:TonB-linked SusC/RagA family outer membrane protein